MAHDGLIKTFPLRGIKDSAPYLAAVSSRSPPQRLIFLDDNLDLRQHVTILPPTRLADGIQESRRFRLTFFQHCDIFSRPHALTTGQASQAKVVNG